jgi:pimeloyl-ACP methyl ester carboxylesterase
MDLPAHGKSTKNQRAWTVEAFGDDVAAVIDHLNLEKVVLVGHSMGGDIMLEAALKKPEAVIGMIGIDNFKDVGVSLDAATAQAMDQFFEGLANNYTATINFFASQYLFSSQTDDQSKQRVVNSMLNADSVIAAEVLTELFIYSPLEIPKLEEIGKKLYLINSDYTPTITENMDKVGIAYEVMTIAGTGHYPMIEKPQEFNEILNKALLKLLKEL